MTSSGRPRSSGVGISAGHQAEHGAHRVALDEGRHAEAALAGDGVGRGQLAVLEEPLALALGEHPEHEAADVGAVERRHALDAAELALDADDRRRAHGEVQVGAAEPQHRGRGGRRAARGAARGSAPVGRRTRPCVGHRRPRAPGRTSASMRRTRSSRTATAGSTGTPRSPSRAATTCSSPGSSITTTTPSGRRSSATAR